MAMPAITHGHRCSGELHMARYRFDGKAFFKTFFGTILFCGIAAILFGIFWEDKPSQERAVKQSRDKLYVYLEMVGVDVLIGAGAGVGLGLLFGYLSALSRKPQGRIWGD